MRRRTRRLFRSLRLPLLQTSSSGACSLASSVGNVFPISVGMAPPYCCARRLIPESNVVSPISLLPSSACKFVNDRARCSCSTSTIHTSSTAQRLWHTSDPSGQPPTTRTGSTLSSGTSTTPTRFEAETKMTTIFVVVGTGMLRQPCSCKHSSCGAVNALLAAVSCSKAAGRR